MVQSGDHNLSSFISSVVSPSYTANTNFSERHACTYAMVTIETQLSALLLCVLANMTWCHYDSVLVY